MCNIYKHLLISIVSAAATAAIAKGEEDPAPVHGQPPAWAEVCAFLRLALLCFQLTRYSSSVDLTSAMPFPGSVRYREVYITGTTCAGVVLWTRTAGSARI